MNGARTVHATEVLPQNKAGLAVIRRSGLPMQVTPAADAVHVTFSIAME